MKPLRATLCLFLASALAFSAAAGNPGRSDADFSRHEFFFSGSLAYSTYLCFPHQGMSAKWEGYVEEGAFLPCLFPVDLGYTYRFNRHWGLSTGVGIHMHEVFYGDTGTHTHYYDAEHIADNAGSTLSVDPPGHQMTKVIGEQYYCEWEEHNMVGIYVTVPVLVQYRRPLGYRKWDLYGQGGLKMAFLLFDEIESDGSRLHYQQIGTFQEGATWKTMLGPSRSKGGYHSDGTVRPYNVYASLEVGVRIPLGRSFGIYAGGFVDLGLLRATPVQDCAVYCSYDSRGAALFNAVEDAATVTFGNGSYSVTRSTEPYLRGVLPVSAGLRIRFAL